jgi:hypothetical protein
MLIHLSYDVTENAKEKTDANSDGIKLWIVAKLYDKGCRVFSNPVATTLIFDILNSEVAIKNLFETVYNMSEIINSAMSIICEHIKTDSHNPFITEYMEKTTPKNGRTMDERFKEDLLPLITKDDGYKSYLSLPPKS